MFLKIHVLGGKWVLNICILLFGDIYDPFFFFEGPLKYFLLGTRSHEWSNFVNGMGTFFAILFTIPSI